MSCSSTTVTKFDSCLEQRKAKLTPLEYRVTQEKVTERPFSNRYNRHWERGTYHCVLCNTELFKSESKFESKSGWPAFDNVVEEKRVRLKPDLSHVGANLLLIISRPDLARTEVSCSNCNAHLGHLFKDGPKPTGLRYCINSNSLNFVPFDSKSEADPPPTQTQTNQPLTVNKDKKSEISTAAASSSGHKIFSRVVPGQDQAPCGKNLSSAKICFFTANIKPPIKAAPAPNTFSKVPNIGRRNGDVNRMISVFQNRNGHVPEVVSRQPSGGILRETSL